jgi:hypothetical protein
LPEPMQTARSISTSTLTGRVYVPLDA